MTKCEGYSLLKYDNV